MKGLVLLSPMFAAGGDGAVPFRTVEIDPTSTATCELISC
jgi:hypothetical protein